MESATEVNMNNNNSSDREKAGGGGIAPLTRRLGSGKAGGRLDDASWIQTRESRSRDSSVLQSHHRDKPAPKKLFTVGNDSGWIRSASSSGVRRTTGSEDLWLRSRSRSPQRLPRKKDNFGSSNSNSITSNTSTSAAAEKSSRNTNGSSTASLVNRWNSNILEPKKLRIKAGDAQSWIKTDSKDSRVTRTTEPVRAIHIPEVTTKLQETEQAKEAKLRPSDMGDVKLRLQSFEQGFSRTNLAHSRDHSRERNYPKGKEDGISRVQMSMKSAIALFDKSNNNTTTKVDVSNETEKRPRRAGRSVGINGAHTESHTVKKDTVVGEEEKEQALDTNGDEKDVIGKEDLTLNTDYSKGDNGRDEDNLSVSDNSSERVTETESQDKPDTILDESSRIHAYDLPSEIEEPAVIKETHGANRGEGSNTETDIDIKRQEVVLTPPDTVTTTHSVDHTEKGDNREDSEDETFVAQGRITLSSTVKGSTGTTGKIELIERSVLREVVENIPKNELTDVETQVKTEQSNTTEEFVSNDSDQFSQNTTREEEQNVDVPTEEKYTLDSVQTIEEAQHSIEEGQSIVEHDLALGHSKTPGALISQEHFENKDMRPDNVITEEVVDKVDDKSSEGAEMEKFDTKFKSKDYENTPNIDSQIQYNEDSPVVEIHESQSYEDSFAIRESNVEPEDHFQEIEDTLVVKTRKEEHSDFSLSKIDSNLNQSRQGEINSHITPLDQDQDGAYCNVSESVKTDDIHTVNEDSINEQTVIDKSAVLRDFNTVSHSDNLVQYSVGSDLYSDTNRSQSQQEKGESVESVDGHEVSYDMEESKQVEGEKPTAEGNLLKQSLSVEPSNEPIDQTATLEAEEKHHEKFEERDSTMITKHAIQLKYDDKNQEESNPSKITVTQVKDFKGEEAKIPQQEDNDKPYSGETDSTLLELVERGEGAALDVRLRRGSGKTSESSIETTGECPSSSGDCFTVDGGQTGGDYIDLPTDGPPPGGTLEESEVSAQVENEPNTVGEVDHGGQYSTENNKPTGEEGQEVDKSCGLTLDDRTTQDPHYPSTETTAHCTSLNDLHTSIAEQPVSTIVSVNNVPTDKSTSSSSVAVVEEQECGDLHHDNTAGEGRQRGCLLEDYIVVDTALVVERGPTEEHQIGHVPKPSPEGFGRYAMEDQAALLLNHDNPGGESRLVVEPRVQDVENPIETKRRGFESKCRTSDTGSVVVEQSQPSGDFSDTGSTSDETDNDSGEEQNPELLGYKRLEDNEDSAKDSSEETQEGDSSEGEERDTEEEILECEGEEKDIKEEILEREGEPKDTEEEILESEGEVKGESEGEDEEEVDEEDEEDLDDSDDSECEDCGIDYPWVVEKAWGLETIEEREEVDTERRAPLAQFESDEDDDHWYCVEPKEQQGEIGEGSVDEKEQVDYTSNSEGHNELNENENTATIENDSSSVDEINDLTEDTIGATSLKVSSKKNIELAQSQVSHSPADINTESLSTMATLDSGPTSSEVIYTQETVAPPEAQACTTEAPSGESIESEIKGVDRSMEPGVKTLEEVDTLEEVVETCIEETESRGEETSVSCIQKIQVIEEEAPEDQTTDTVRHNEVNVQEIAEEMSSAVIFDALSSLTESSDVQCTNPEVEVHENEITSEIVSDTEEALYEENVEVLEGELQQGSSHSPIDTIADDMSVMVISDAMQSLQSFKSDQNIEENSLEIISNEALEENVEAEIEEISDDIPDAESGTESLPMVVSVVVSEAVGALECSPPDEDENRASGNQLEDVDEHLESLDKSFGDSGESVSLHTEESSVQKEEAQTDAEMISREIISEVSTSQDEAVESRDSKELAVTHEGNAEDKQYVKDNTISEDKNDSQPTMLEGVETTAESIVYFNVSETSEVKNANGTRKIDQFENDITTESSKLAVAEEVRGMTETCENDAQLNTNEMPGKDGEIPKEGIMEVNENTEVISKDEIPEEKGIVLQSEEHSPEALTVDSKLSAEYEETLTKTSSEDITDKESSVVNTTLKKDTLHTVKRVEPLVEKSHDEQDPQNDPPQANPEHGIVDNKSLNTQTEEAISISKENNEATRAERSRVLREVHYIETVGVPRKEREKSEETAPKRRRRKPTPSVEEVEMKQLVQWISSGKPRTGEPKQRKMLNGDVCYDKLILEVFEESETIFFPIQQQKEARNFIKALYMKGVTYESLCQEIGEHEHNFTSWRKSLGRAGIGHSVMNWANRPLQDLLDDEEEDEDDGMDDVDVKAEEERIKEEERLHEEEGKKRLQPIIEPEKVKKSVDHNKNDQKDAHDMNGSRSEAVNGVVLRKPREVTPPPQLAKDGKPAKQQYEQIPDPIRMRRLQEFQKNQESSSAELQEIRDVRKRISLFENQQSPSKSGSTSREESESGEQEELKTETESLSSTSHASVEDHEYSPEPTETKPKSPEPVFEAIVPQQAAKVQEKQPTTNGSSSSSSSDKLNSSTPTESAPSKAKKDQVDAGSTTSPDIGENYNSDLDPDNDMHSPVQAIAARKIASSRTNKTWSGFIYVFSDTAANSDTCRVKVGASAFPHKRLRQAQLFNPDMYQVHTVAVKQRSAALEQVLAQLEPYRLSGQKDWFEGPFNDLLGAISDVAARFPSSRKIIENNDDDDDDVESAC